MFPNGNIGGFQHKLLKPFKVVYYHTKQSEQSTYAGSWYNSQHMAAFRLRKRTLHFMHIIQDSVFLVHLASFFGGRFEKMSRPIMSYICWCFRYSNLRSICSGWLHQASRVARNLQWGRLFMGSGGVVPSRRRLGVWGQSPQSPEERESCGGAPSARKLCIFWQN